jgi:hypothetical protein
MPAAIVTYTTLVADMKAYAARGTATDKRFNDNLPVMIARAENRCAMALKTLVTRPVQQATLTIGNPLLPKPSYWRNNVSMMIAYGENFANQAPLELRTKEYIQTYWQTPATKGQPKFYGDFDNNHWIFAPTPLLAYPVQYVTDQTPIPLSEENQSNTYTAKAPIVLQAACFLEADIFLKNLDTIDMRQKDFDNAATLLMGEKAIQQTDRVQRTQT